MSIGQPRYLTRSSNTQLPTTAPLDVPKTVPIYPPEQPPQKITTTSPTWPSMTPPKPQKPPKPPTTSPSENTDYTPSNPWQPFPYPSGGIDAPPSAPPPSTPPPSTPPPVSPYINPKAGTIFTIGGGTSYPVHNVSSALSSEDGLLERLKQSPFPWLLLAAVALLAMRSTRR